MLRRNVAFQEIKVSMWNSELWRLSAFNFEILHPRKGLCSFQFVSSLLPAGTQRAPWRQRVKWLDVAPCSEKDTSSKWATEKAALWSLAPQQFRWAGRLLDWALILMLRNASFFLNRAAVLKIVFGFGGFLCCSQVPRHFLYFCFKRGVLSSFGFYQIIQCAKASISRTDGLHVHENTCLLKKLNW